MFSALFDIIINLLATIIQLIVWPINELITTALPDLSDKIVFVNNSFSSIFTGIGWALGVLPEFIRETLIFILTVELAKVTIFTSTHALTKVWTVLQKIKFW